MIHLAWPWFGAAAAAAVVGLCFAVAHGVTWCRPVRAVRRNAGHRVDQHGTRVLERARNFHDHLATAGGRGL